jgi:predicted amidohydrolase
MRIALLQIRVQPESRSANLSHLLRRVVQAVETVPAPDLLMLPAGCDGTSAQGVTEAMAQGFGESLAAAAREWGVYVAAGFLRVCGSVAKGQARLYDPDGDVVAWSAADDGAEDCGVFETSLGRLCIQLSDGCTLASAPDEPCDILLVCARPGERPAPADPAWLEQLADTARRTNAILCVASAVDGAGDKGEAESPGGSAVFDQTGRCVVTARPGAEETVMGEVNMIIT